MVRIALLFKLYAAFTFPNYSAMFNTRICFLSKIELTLQKKNVNSSGYCFQISQCHASEGILTLVCGGMWQPIALTTRKAFISADCFKFMGAAK